jgi:hypothetical protein
LHEKRIEKEYFALYKESMDEETKYRCCLLVVRSKFNLLKLKVNSVALVRKQTIPTERSPLVGEVTANSCG